jgi:hypothetical protein
MSIIGYMPESSITTTAPCNRQQAQDCPWLPLLKAADGWLGPCSAGVQVSKRLDLQRAACSAVCPCANSVADSTPSSENRYAPILWPTQDRAWGEALVQGTCLGLQATEDQLRHVEVAAPCRKPLPLKPGSPWPARLPPSSIVPGCSKPEKLSLP